jgi:hypothetical protein
VPVRSRIQRFKEIAIMRTRTRFPTIASVAAASVLASILAATQAEARGKRAAATPTMAAKSNAVVRDHRAGTAAAARRLPCRQSCSERYGDNAPTTGTYKPLPKRPLPSRPQW